MQQDIVRRGVAFAPAADGEIQPCIKSCRVDEAGKDVANGGSCRRRILFGRGDKQPRVLCQPIAARDFGIPPRGCRSCAHRFALWVIWRGIDYLCAAFHADHMQG